MMMRCMIFLAILGFFCTASVLSFAPPQLVLSTPATAATLASSSSTTTTTTTTQLRGLGFGTLFGIGTDDRPTKEQVHRALQDPRTVLVDARTLDEIRQTGYLHSRTNRNIHHRWIHAPGSPFENPILDMAAQDMIPDRTTPVLVYCASGKRAGKAKHVLEDKGYQTVLNLGGYHDAKDLLQ